MSSGRVSPYLLLVLTNLFWAGNFVVGRAVHGAIPPASLAFCRWAIALAILTPFAARSVRREWPEVRRHWPILALLGSLSVCVFSTLLFIGLSLTTATNALLLNSTAPVLIVLVGWMALGEPVTIRQAVGIAVSLLGVLTIVFKGAWAGVTSLQFGAGDLWVMAAVTVWAIYTVLLRRRPSSISPMVFLAVTIAAGTTAALPLFLLEMAAGRTMTLTAASMSGLLYVGIFPSLLSHAFWNRAVKEVGANRAGLFIHLTPVFGSLLAVLFLGESLHGYHAAGMALILVGIVTTTRPSDGRKPRA